MASRTLRVSTQNEMNEVPLEGCFLFFVYCHFSEFILPQAAPPHELHVALSENQHGLTSPLTLLVLAIINNIHYYFTRTFRGR